MLRWECVFPWTLTLITGVSLGFQRWLLIGMYRSLGSWSPGKLSLILFPVVYRLQYWYRFNNLTRLKNLYGPVSGETAYLYNPKNNHPKSFPGGTSCYLSSLPTYLDRPLRCYCNLSPHQWSTIPKLPHVKLWPKDDWDQRWAFNNSRGKGSINRVSPWNIIKTVRL